MSELKLQQTRLDGRYDVLDCLGRGSYAEIYVARDEAAAPGAPRTVVIKALNLNLQGALDAELEHTLIENFRNEAIALDRVRHPNVINRLGHGTAIDLTGQTFHYLVLEYMPGGDTATLCRRNPLPLDRALHYLEQVCAGLAYAHDHGVIHRDIKPQNLLLTADRETIKIGDFGVAKIEAFEGAITRVGTDVYAAPEHHPLRQTGPLDTSTLSGPPAQLTPAADIYSLAKTTYMLLTGEAPRRFSQQPITELPAQFAAAPWAGFVLRVLRKATATNPARRYQSVPEFWADLRDVALPQTQLLQPPPAGAETRPLTPVRHPGSAELPPAPRPVEFEPRERAALQRGEGPAHPRIVVPVHTPPPPPRPQPQLPARPNGSAAPASGPERQQQLDRPARRQPAAEPREPLRQRLFAGDRLRRWLVVLLLLCGFALLLLGTYHYVSQLRGTRPAQPAQGSTNTAPANANLQTGREMTTITNVNLRTGPARTYQKIGEAERGSRVRVLQCNNNWCEVQLLEHGQPHAPAGGAEQGWLDAHLLR